MAQLPRRRADRAPTQLRKALREATLRLERRARCCAARRSRTRACSRCSTRSSTTCRRRSTCRRSRARTRRRARRSQRKAERRRAVRGARLQDDDRPARRPPHLPPRLLGHASKPGEQVLNATQRPARSASAACSQMHANKREEIEEVYAGDIVAVVGLQGRRHRRHALRPRTRRSCSSRSSSRSPVISIAIEPKTQGRHGQARRVARARSRRRIRRSACSTDPETGQTHHLRAWASSTSRSSSTACCASSRSRPTSASRRSPTRRRSRKPVRVEGRYIKQTGGTGEYGVVVLEVEPGRAGLGLRVRERGRRAARSRASSSRPVRAGLRGGAAERRARGLPGGRRRRCASSTASPTTSTRPSAPSRSPARWRMKEALRPGRAACCSSRS